MKQLLVVFLLIGNVLAVNYGQHESKVFNLPQVLGNPNVREVASVRLGATMFIGTWSETPQDQVLRIYEMSEYPNVHLINEFEDHDVPWQSLTAIQDAAVIGFQVRRTTGEGWFGATLVYLYVQGEFKKVFESGALAEMFDLNGDGYPEALEYQDDKSNLKCRVKINVWKDDRYQYVMTVPLDRLVSSETRKRIDQFLHSAYPALPHDGRRQ